MYKVHIFILLVVSGLFFHAEYASSQVSSLEVRIPSGASVQDSLATFYPEILPFDPHDTITWINDDDAVHSVTSGLPEHPDYSGVFFKTGSMEYADSHTITTENLVNFAYYYFCEVHPWMTGKLVLATAPEAQPETDDAIVASDHYKQGSDLKVTGFVHKDFAKTPYQILIYQHQDRLIDIKQGLFSDDASYANTIKTDDLVPSKYMIKLVYGLPTQVATMTIEISGQDAIPDWIKTEARNWSAGVSTDLEFVNAIEYMVKENIIVHQDEPQQSKMVPAWLKTNASWWADESITDSEFAVSIQYLLNAGVIRI